MRTDNPVPNVHITTQKVEGGYEASANIGNERVAERSYDELEAIAKLQQRIQLAAQGPRG